MQSINIYPNPLTTNSLTIDLIGYKDIDNVNIRITNLTGQTVYEKLENNPKLIELITSNLLNKSVYIVSVKSGKTSLSNKFLTN